MRGSRLCLSCRVGAAALLQEPHASPHPCSLTSLLPHAHRQDDGAEDVEPPDDPRGDHVGVPLRKKGSGEGGLVLALPGSRAGPWAHHVHQRAAVVRHVHVPHGGRGVALTDEEGALDAGGDHLAHDLALDGGAHHGAQHLHRHAWGEAAGLSAGLPVPPSCPLPNLLPRAGGAEPAQRSCSPIRTRGKGPACAG